MSIAHSGRLPVPTPFWEFRLIVAAQQGDVEAQSRLISHYEPLVRHIAATTHLAGADRDDLAQHVRVSLLDAIRAWEPSRGVPFRAFAALCARREAWMVAAAASCSKHLPLNGARPIDAMTDANGHALAETLAARDRPDEDPVAKTIGREHLREILARMSRLSRLERDAITLAAADRPYVEIACALGVGERAVNNALQRGRRKLAAHAA